MKSKSNRLIAVIDLGAHSMRMFLGQIVRKGVFKQVEQLWVPISIGKDTFKKGVVSNQTIKDVISVLKNFKEVMYSYDVKNVYAVATSSLREASNSDVMIERIYKTTGIRIKVIEAIVEANILYQGIVKVLKDRYGFMEENAVLFSLGAGSTHIIFQSKGKVLFSETFHQGTLRLLRNEERPDRYYSYIVRPLTVNFSQNVKRFDDIKTINRFVVINDDARKLIEGMEECKLVNGVYRITRKRFMAMADRISAMSQDKLIKKYHVLENMAGTTKLAFLMINTFFTLSDAREIIFPVVSLSSALLSQISLSDQGLQLEHKGLEQDNIVSASRSIGLKYQYDSAHANKVTQLALSLFDQMRDQYGFSNQERLLLEVAAILHDIGAFISAGSHHKHSARLILTSEIMGLNHTELKIISQIARYHRKATPKPTHSEYMNLNIEDRVMVSRLAALLRLADALDTIHTQQIGSIRVDIDDIRCILHVDITNMDELALDIFRLAVKNKGDLFESFFGIPVQLERLL